jgi:hypothetical protein
MRKIKRSASLETKSRDMEWSMVGVKVCSFRPRKQMEKLLRGVMQQGRMEYEIPDFRKQDFRKGLL